MKLVFLLLVIIILFVLEGGVHAFEAVSMPNNCDDCGCTVSCGLCSCGQKRTITFTGFDCEDCGNGKCGGGGSCKDCTYGQYGLVGRACCVGGVGDTHCPTCTPGTFSNSSTGNHACFKCNAGSRSEKQSGSTKCIFCDAGYDSGSQRKSCDMCPAGTFNDRTGGICRPCSAGKFSNISGATSCLLCNAGTYSKRGATSCFKCAIGSYSHVAGGGINNCTACPDGESTNETGSTSCTKCAAGEFASGGFVSCKSCGVGTFSVEGSANCTPCSSGTYSNTNSSSVCIPCAKGQYSDTDGSTSCKLCPIGYSSGEGAKKCDACPPGYTTDRVGASLCIPCDAGSYSKGGSSCIACSSGHYAPQGSSKCFECLPGEYAATTGAASCAACNCGHFSSQKGAQRCTKCSSGSFSSSSNSSSCQKCVESTFQDREASCSSCQTCGDGKTGNLKLGATSCVDCLPGTFGVDGFCNGFCPAGYESSAGSTTIADCGTCKAATNIHVDRGYYNEKSGEACKACPCKNPNSPLKTLQEREDCYWAPEEGMTECVPLPSITKTRETNSPSKSETETISETLTPPPTPTKIATNTSTRSESLGSKSSTSSQSNIVSKSTATNEETISHCCAATSSNSSSESTTLSKSRPSHITKSETFSFGTRTITLRKPSRGYTSPPTETLTMTDTYHFILPERVFALSADTEVLTATATLSAISGAAHYANAASKIAAIERLTACGTVDSRTGEAVPPTKLAGDQNFLGFSIGDDVLATQRAAIVGNSGLILGIAVLSLCTAGIVMVYLKIPFDDALTKTRPGYICVALQIVSPATAAASTTMLSWTQLGGTHFDLPLVMIGIFASVLLPLVWFAWIVYKGRKIKLRSYQLDDEEEVIEKQEWEQSQKILDDLDRGIIISDDESEDDDDENENDEEAEYSEGENSPKASVKDFSSSFSDNNNNNDTTNSKSKSQKQEDELDQFLGLGSSGSSRNKKEEQEKENDENENFSDNNSDYSILSKKSSSRKTNNRKSRHNSKKNNKKNNNKEKRKNQSFTAKLVATSASVQKELVRTVQWSTSKLTWLWNFVFLKTVSYPKCSLVRKNGPSFESFTFLEFLFVEHLTLVTIGLSQGISTACTNGSCCFPCIGIAVCCALIHTGMVLARQLPYTTRMERFVNSTMSVMTSILALFILANYATSGSFISMDYVKIVGQIALICGWANLIVAVLWNLLPGVGTLRRYLKKYFEAKASSRKAFSENNNNDNNDGDAINNSFGENENEELLTKDNFSPKGNDVLDVVGDHTTTTTSTVAVAAAVAASSRENNNKNTLEERLLSEKKSNEDQEEEEEEEEQQQATTNKKKKDGHHLNSLLALDQETSSEREGKEEQQQQQRKKEKQFRERRVKELSHLDDQTAVGLLHSLAPRLQQIERTRKMNQELDPEMEALEKTLKNKITAINDLLSVRAVEIAPHQRFSVAPSLNSLMTEDGDDENNNISINVAAGGPLPSQKVSNSTAAAASSSSSSSKINNNNNNSSSSAKNRKRSASKSKNRIEVDKIPL